MDSIKTFYVNPSDEFPYYGSAYKVMARSDREAAIKYAERKFSQDPLNRFQGKVEVYREYIWERLMNADFPDTVEGERMLERFHDKHHVMTYEIDYYIPPPEFTARALKRNQ